jgi:hypothetical protein
MTVYAVFTTGKNSPMVTGFSSEKEAHNSGNGFNLVSTPTDLRKSIFKTSDLVDIYNLNSERKIQKFRDRATAEKRVWESFSSVKVNSDLPKVESEPKAEKPKAEKPKGRPKQNIFKGAKFVANASDKGKNPRRSGTHGWRFMDLIIKNPGISFQRIQESYFPGEKFMHHLKWDLDHGNIFVKYENDSKENNEKFALILSMNEKNKKEV